MNDLAAWSQHVKSLDTALARLLPLAESLGVAAPRGEEWFALLEQKLLPQLTGEPWLVVAVVGGTNIGKSLIFNQLAGEEASAVSPLAAGTRHPVCLAPEGFAATTTLHRLFPGFELRSWRSPADALDQGDRHLLFWRESPTVPPRLLLLDTPDIDSDAQVNWERADRIGHAADVLLAVITQQKYNDAAIKQFFRKSAAADKPVIVLFNQCELAEDREYWPQWLQTFVGETGADPILVYVVPYDRAAAKDRRLPFFNVGRDGRMPIGEEASLRDELAALRFDEIKLRTLRGALAKLLDAPSGAPSYFVRVGQAADDFAAAAAALSAHDMARVTWPPLPPRILVDEIRQWWDDRRSQWSRSIHHFYRKLGDAVTWPLRRAWHTVSAPVGDPATTFQRDERAAIFTAVQRLLAELERLSQIGNATLRPRLQKLLAGQVRADLLRRIEASHAELPPVDDDYRNYLRRELDQWGHDNPRVVSFLRSLDHVAALARPAITVSLAVSGWLVAGGLVHDAAVQAAGHTVGQMATEAAITGGIATGGEALVATTGEGIKQAAAQLFRRLQSHYAQQRARWLAAWLEKELLGSLLQELREGAEVTQHDAFVSAQASLRALELLARRNSPPEPSLQAAGSPSA
jgi:hypothetical protein